jgi:hypothetical protein
MKKGMKLSEFTFIETEYENAAALPDKRSAEQYCKEMNGRNSGWTVEEGVFNGKPCWRVVRLGN